MGETRADDFIRFPIDGRDLRILAEARPPGFLPRKADILPEEDVESRAEDLVDAGILQATSGSGGADRFEARSPRLSMAARDALNQRSNLVDDLESPTDLAVLSALPHPFEAPKAWDLVGIPEETWKENSDRLLERGVLVEGEASLEPNPRLTSFGRFLEGYRELYHKPPEKGVEPQTGDRGLESSLDLGPSWLCIHRRSVETAWRIRNGRPGPSVTPVGPSAGLELFDPLLPAHTYAYHGPRELDRWDHMFLYCRAVQFPHPSSTTTGPDGAHIEERETEVPFRPKALFLAMTEESIARDPEFRERAWFYGLEWLVDEAHSFHQRGEHPLADEVRRFREEFSVGEGSLAR